MRGVCIYLKIDSLGILPGFLQTAVLGLATCSYRTFVWSKVGFSYLFRGISEPQIEAVRVCLRAGLRQHSTPLIRLERGGVVFVSIKNRYPGFFHQDFADSSSKTCYLLIRAFVQPKGGFFYLFRGICEPQIEAVEVYLRAGLGHSSTPLIRLERGCVVFVSIKNRYPGFLPGFVQTAVLGHATCL